MQSESVFEQINDNLSLVSHEAYLDLVYDPVEKILSSSVTRLITAGAIRAKTELARDPTLNNT